MAEVDKGGTVTVQTRVSKLTVASMIPVISYAIILCVIVTWKSILLGILGIWVMLILPALAMLAIILAAKGENRIKRSNGTLTGRRWATAAGIAGVSLLLFSFLVMISLPAYIAYTRRGYDADVKSKIKNAAKAQTAYYRDNGSYATDIDSLPRFDRSSNVTITVEVTAATFVITGTRTKGCKANTGIWNLSSTDGSISGTRCQKY